MPRFRFLEVDGDDLNADGGFVEVTADGLVRISTALEWIVDPDSMLVAPSDPQDMDSPSTCPAEGFHKVGEDKEGASVWAPVPAEGWDGREWLDKVRYHFRTPYMRPQEIEE